MIGSNWIRLANDKWTASTIVCKLSTPEIKRSDGNSTATTERWMRLIPN